MATTFTVTSPASGDTLYTFSPGLDFGEESAPIDASAANRILFQVCSSVAGSASDIELLGSLDGINWVTMYQPGINSFTSAVITNLVAVPVKAQTAGTAIYETTATRFLKAKVSSGSMTGVKICILLRTRPA